MEIHERIRAFLKQEKLSIAQFERELGLNRNAIANILQAKSKIPHTVFERIAETYSAYSAFWILTGASKDEIMRSYLEELKEGVDGVFDDFKKKI